MVAAPLSAMQGAYEQPAYLEHAAKRAAMLPGCGAVLPPGKKASEALLNYLKVG